MIVVIETKSERIIFKNVQRYDIPTENGEYLYITYYEDGKGVKTWFKRKKIIRMDVF